VPSLALCFGFVLLVAGPGLAIFERRVFRRLLSLQADAAGARRHGDFLRRRSARRKAIGLWIGLLGASIIAGELVESREHPILYIGCWSAAAVIAVVLVRLAVLDYIALRRHWGAELLRTTNELERARNDLSRHIGPDAEAPKP